MRELFGYKTLGLQKKHKMHSNLSKKPFLVIKGVDDLNLQGWSGVTNRRVCIDSHKCGYLCCKGLIEKESMDSKLACGHVSKFYMW